MAITKYAVRRPTQSMWRDVGDVQDRFARLMDDPFFSNARTGRWMPPVGVSETAGELLLTAELPGLSEEDIAIDLDNNVLTISGEKSETRTEGDEERRYHVWERNFGSFKRSFTLPRTVDGSNIVATFEKGVLTVTLPKVADAKGRKIEISK